MDKTTTKISYAELMNWEQQKRTNLINSIGGFKSIGLIGTINTKGQTNLAIFNSFVHLGANPPLIGCILRPTPEERHTYSNIQETGYYTINHINESICQQGHQTSARYPKDSSEFESTGLTSVFKDAFAAPYVLESKIQLGLEFKERIPIPINGTSLMIGEIKHLYFPSDCILEDGFIDLEKANSLAGSGLDSYHITKKVVRLPYAKVK